MAKQSKIMITGANGTIGQLLVNKLQINHNVIGITRNECDLTDSVRVSEMMMDIKPDIVIHAASAGGKTKLGEYNKDELYSNISMITNISDHYWLYKHLINIGSGAEYNLNYSIDNVEEWHLSNPKLIPLPTDSYGLSKYIVNRIRRNTKNSTTLRVFGCFDKHEPDFRLLKKFTTAIKTGREFILEKDRKFSWISGNDLAKVINYIICKKSGWWTKYMPCEINIAYPETANMKLSDVLNLWCKLHNINPNYKIASMSSTNYTCATILMDNYISIKLDGLEKSLKEYE